MHEPRRIAIQLDLQWPYKRHAALFVGTQQYARERGWESITDEFVAEHLPARTTVSLPERARNLPGALRSSASPW